MIPLANYSVAIGRVPIAIHELVAVILVFIRALSMGRDSYRHGARLRTSPIDVTVYAFATSVLLTVLISRDVPTSIFWARGMSIFVILYLDWRLSRSERCLARLSDAITVAGTWSAVWGVSQLIAFVLGMPIPKHPSAIMYGVSPVYGTVVPRITGPYTNPDSLALLLSITTPVTIANAVDKTRNGRATHRMSVGWLVLCCSVVQAVALIMTLSTGGTLALLAGLVVCGLDRSIRRGVRKGFTIAVIAVLICGSTLRISTSWDYRTYARFVWDEFLSIADVPAYIQTGQSAVHRLAGWRASLRVWAESPVWGVGMNGTSTAVARYLGYELSPHSLLFATLGDMGLMGLLSLGALYYTVWRSNAKTRHAERVLSTGIAACSLAYLVVALTTGTYVFDNSQAMTWCIMGTVACMSSKRTYAGHVCCSDSTEGVRP